jgi:hypothetical protein
MRGTTNGNARGNSRARAARKRWLLKTWAADIGPGFFCRCYRCGRLLGFSLITVDRIVPGCQGGRYVRGNIRPSCAACNSETGGAVRG